MLKKAFFTHTQQFQFDIKYNHTGCSTLLHNTTDTLITN